MSDKPNQSPSTVGRSETKWGLVADKLTAILANEHLTEDEHDAIAAAVNYLDECDGEHRHAKQSPSPTAMPSEPYTMRRGSEGEKLWTADVGALLACLDGAEAGVMIPQKRAQRIAEDLIRIRDALMRPPSSKEQSEPVAWMVRWNGCASGPVETVFEVALQKARDSVHGAEVVPLYFAQSATAIPSRLTREFIDKAADALSSDAMLTGSPRRIIQLAHAAMIAAASTRSEIK